MRQWRGLLPFLAKEGGAIYINTEKEETEVWLYLERDFREPIANHPQARRAGLHTEEPLFPPHYHADREHGRDKRDSIGQRCVCWPEERCKKQ